VGVGVRVVVAAVRPVSRIEGQAAGVNRVAGEGSARRGAAGWVRDLRATSVVGTANEAGLWAGAIARVSATVRVTVRVGAATVGTATCATLAAAAAITRKGTS
jgi:hypothetical protein